MRQRNILATKNKKRKEKIIEGDGKKETGKIKIKIKISEEDRVWASEEIQTHTGRLRRATTTEINQQLKRAGAILRLAALNAVASRL